MRPKRIVMDANVLIKYAMYGQLYRLATVILDYDLLVYVNGTLLKEIHVALHDRKLLKDDSKTIDEIMDLLASITIKVTTASRYQLCPDPTDNFLFDIALQNHCQVLITDEKRILGFEQSPLPVHPLKWFKEVFPFEQ